VSKKTGGKEMLKGVNRQVVEVSQPNSRYFERILYIVKPEFSGLSQAKLMSEAGKLNQNQSARPPKMKSAKKHAVLITMTLLAGLAAVITVITLLLK
jgi:hypothetical protein